MLKKATRTAQNFFPGLAEAKNHAYHFARQWLGQVHERDFAANRGQSILAIRHYRPDARIVSFEPGVSRGLNMFVIMDRRLHAS